MSANKKTNTSKCSRFLALPLGMFFVNAAFALDFSYNPEEDSGTQIIYVASQKALTLIDDTTEHVLTFFSNTPQKEEKADDEYLQTSNAIRLDFSDSGKKERGWKLTPALALSESMVFKDDREAVQWADAKNEPKDYDASIDKALEKMGISYYQINLQAEYTF
ncbi:MAG: hypothetical protein H7A01_00295 [Hahellaceae bacterium]|nr:hypothetical protein [Hahellaceae bacterium]MCP5210744.1 hypothetical protein [Hahellaceae bacterium]